MSKNCKGCVRYELSTLSQDVHKTKYQTIAESTHVAVMIYYGKTLFGSEPKLTAVQN